MDLNRRNVKKILLIIAFAIVLFLGLQNIDNIYTFCKVVFSLLSPFLMGLCIAFILNVPMKFIEEKFFRLGGKHDKLVRKLKRPLSLVLTIIFVLALIFFVMFIIIPELGNTFDILQKNIPVYIGKINSWITELLVKFPELENWISTITIDWNKLGDTAFSFLKNGAGSVLNSTVSAATSVISGVVNFFLGAVFACYVLLQKEKLARQVKQILYAFIPEKKADEASLKPSSHRVDKFLAICSLANRTFSNFIAGQCTEAVILGLMFFVSLSVFQFKYALMISVMTAFFALIPIFGAIISMFIGAFLILMASGPIQALWFIVLFQVVQQIEGNFIYPHVVGNSVGLPSIWVLVAVTLGGSTMGVIGMLINIPLFSVIYALIKGAVGERLKEKKISPTSIQ